MKININSLKIAPKHFDFKLCVYGPLSDELVKWVKFWDIPTNIDGQFTNILIQSSHKLCDMFYDIKIYEYIDGFSPNLNKHLHLGHLSNFVLAKAFQKMKVGKKFIAIFGDTLTGNVSKDNALDMYQHYCQLFDYKIDKSFFASDMKLSDFSFLEAGTEEYHGTKIFNIDNEKVVAIKSDGLTTYMYQDIALAQELNASTLYMTGFEQDQHFKNLKKLYKQIDHIGLGLVYLNNKKMSSSEGNIIFINDFINALKEKFDDYKLIWNILAGVILKSEPESIKKIDTNVITNVKLSSGLYVSYTMAKMNSAGIKLIAHLEYLSKDLEFKALKAKTVLKPNILFEGIIEHCKKINILYETHHIKDNETNYKIFQDLTSDLVLAFSEIGLFPIEKV
jgi:arginyl-tRNA synthetase